MREDSGMTDPSGETGDYQVADIYARLRSRVIESDPADIGIEVAGDDVWGVLMETGYPQAVVTLVALADGTISIYFSNGGGIIGLGPYEGPQRALGNLLGFAPHFVKYCVPAESFPLPKEDHTRFYLFTGRGIVTAEAPEEDMGHGRHELSALFNKAQ